MNLLLDTQTLLWFLWADPRLSAIAQALIVNPGNHKYVSVASCWEIAIKVSVGKLKLGEPAYPFLARELPRNNFDLLPMSLEHATAVETLPLHHRDPFDRLLVVQTMIEKLRLVSVDPWFDAYPITRLW